MEEGPLVFSSVPNFTTFGATLSWRGLVTPKFSVRAPNGEIVRQTPKVFRSARTCSRSSITRPSLVGLGFHPPLGQRKTLSFCLFAAGNPSPTKLGLVIRAGNGSMGHGSNGSWKWDGSHGSWVARWWPMTHQFFNSMAGFIYCGHDNIEVSSAVRHC